MLKKIWGALRQPAARMSAGALLLIGVIAGGLSWAGFNAALDYTNTTEFCVSCHSMDQLVHQEFKESPHYLNASGVRIGCSDCHVPRPLGLKLVRKLQASNDVWHTILGTVDTPEKFEAKRLEMAERVWKQMTENNSRECRNCHSYDHMAFDKQTPRAREKMEDAKAKNTPCIECHKGIAHKKPVEPRDD